MEPSCLLQLTAAVCLLFYFLFLVFTVLEAWRRRHLPPGPLGWPIVGSLFNIGKPLHRQFAKLSLQYGPIVYLRMGSRPTIVIGSAELAKEVFKKHDVAFAGRPNYSTVFKYISHDFRDLVFAPYGDHWRFLRRICITELFTHSKVNMFAGIRRKELEELAKEISELAAKKEVVNLNILLQQLLTNLMSSVLFGKKFYSSGISTMAEAQAYRDTWGLLAQETGKLYIGDFVPGLRWVDHLRNRDHTIRTKVMPAIKDLLNAVIEERRKQQPVAPDSPRDFVDVMLSLGEGDNLSKSSIVAILQDMLLAGTGTSRATLEWGFTELLRHPQVLKKAQAEIDSVVGKNRPVDEADLRKLPYVAALVKEIMRLHPAAPVGIPHCNAHEVELAGFRIPPNTTLHVNIWAICRDPLVWDKPDEFWPDRFMGRKDSVCGSDFKLIPFSAGQRRCAGMPLALAHVTLTLAYLIHRFDWQLPEGSTEIDMSETTGLASLRTRPLLVTPSSRLSM